MLEKKVEQPLRNNIFLRDTEFQDYAQKVKIDFNAKFSENQMKLFLLKNNTSGTL